MTTKMQTVEEILVLARHGVLKRTPRNQKMIDILGDDILGSLDDDDLYKSFLDHVRDLKGMCQADIAVSLRKLDDEACQVADEIVAFCGF
jgi:hypothetical protein